MRLMVRIDFRGVKKVFARQSQAIASVGLALMLMAPSGATAADVVAATGAATTASSDGAGKNAGTVSEITLDNIEDIAYTLQRIREQAINVYEEATRKRVSHFQLTIPVLTSMPTAPLENQSAYLPLRKGWIVFFVGTMEPLVQILNDHLKHLDARTDATGMPSQYRPEWQGIVGEWSSALRELNAQLDSLASMLNDATVDNVEAAKEAVVIDSQVSKMEKILRKASEFLRDKTPNS